ncbi:MAG: helix-turn-helix domain-containing protein [Candidatus Aminicenantales bacterium]|jgi:excisionase family DNA binding protein
MNINEQAKTEVMMDNFLTVEEICGLLKVKRGTAIRWISSGRLRAFKPGGGRVWRVTRNDFQRFIKGGPDFRAKFIEKGRTKC